MMISLSDKKWTELMGGYKVKYNPLPILKKLEAGLDTQKCWKVLWENLHHQGDIGDASYVSLVKLIDIQEKKANLDWNFYALVGLIEIERLRKTNPPVPDWLRADYKKALSELYKICIKDLSQTQDHLMIRSIIGVLAVLKKKYALAVMILYSDESEVNEYINEHFAWDQLYNPKKAL